MSEAEPSRRVMVQFLPCLTFEQSIVDATGRPRLFFSARRSMAMPLMAPGFGASATSMPQPQRLRDSETQRGEPQASDSANFHLPVASIFYSSLFSCKPTFERTCSTETRFFLLFFNKGTTEDIPNFHVVPLCDNFRKVS